MSIVWHSCTGWDWNTHVCSTACGASSINVLHGRSSKNTGDVTCVECLRWLIADARRDAAESHRLWAESCPDDD